MLTAQTPQALEAALRWGQLPLSIMVVALIWFVSLYLHAGRRWLAWAICGIRLLYVIPNLVGGGNSTLLQIPRLERMQLFGETLTLIQGTTNPLFLLVAPRCQRFRRSDRGQSRGPSFSAIYNRRGILAAGRRDGAQCRRALSKSSFSWM